MYDIDPVDSGVSSENQGLAGVDQIQARDGNWLLNAANASSTTSSSGSSSDRLSAMQMGGIGDIAGGIGAIAGGIADRKRAKGMAQDAANFQKEAEDEMARLRESAPSLSTPAEYFQMAKQAYDTRLMQSRMDDINRSFATTTAAATSAGSRGLGAVLAANEQAQQAAQREVLTQQRLQTDALRTLGRAQESSIQRRENRFNRELSLQNDERLRAIQMGQDAEALKAAGTAAIVGGAGAAIGGAVKVGMGGGVNVGAVAQGAMGAFEEGGMITKGEANHDTNKIHLVQDGEKVGEATGGEAFINKRDWSKMQQLAKKEQGPLGKFVSKLIKRFKQK